eukprot:TRINITY_DN573_c0_g1_i1.p2 TRINITY_DN573_c0_g1~~TRINITY_DN573_c0_g1_i1.p2  ORF type:complete len:129 (-),score=12.56 TRINITY_DN573_c0_g1_i1:817-1203(-)
MKPTYEESEVYRKSLKKVLRDEVKLNEATETSFYSVDTDKDGQINLEEFEAAMKPMVLRLGRDLPEKEKTVKAFETFDVNKDGRLSFEEFKPLFKALLENLTHNGQAFFNLSLLMKLYCGYFYTNAIQ